MGGNQSDLWRPDGDVKYLDEYLVEYAKEVDRRGRYNPEQYDYKVEYGKLKCSYYEYKRPVQTKPEVKRSSVILFDDTFCNKLKNSNIEHVMKPGIKRKYFNETTICAKSGWVVSDEIKTPGPQFSANTFLGVGLETKVHLASEEKYTERHEKEIIFDIEVPVEPNTVKRVLVRLEGSQHKTQFVEKGYYHGNIKIEATDRQRGSKHYIGPVSLFDLCNKFKANTIDIQLDTNSKTVILKTNREINISHFLGREIVDIQEENIKEDTYSNGSYSSQCDTASINSEEFTPRMSKFRPPAKRSHDSGINNAMW